VSLTALAFGSRGRPAHAGRLEEDYNYTTPHGSLADVPPAVHRAGGCFLPRSESCEDSRCSWAKNWERTGRSADLRAPRQSIVAREAREHVDREPRVGSTGEVTPSAAPSNPAAPPSRGRRA
jgi:hypothetical protein